MERVINSNTSVDMVKRKLTKNSLMYASVSEKRALMKDNRWTYNGYQAQIRTVMWKILYLFLCSETTTLTSTCLPESNYNLHTYSKVQWMLQTCWFWKFTFAKFSLPASQFCPVNPAAQVHMYPGESSTSSQVPPFLHRESVQDSSAIELKQPIHNINIKKQLNWFFVLITHVHLYTYM